MRERKKIFLVGSLSNIHIYNYIVNVLSLLDIDIVVYHTASLSTIREDYLDFYKKKGIQIFGGRSIVEIGVINYMRLFYKTIKSLNDYDYLHLHYVNHYLCPILFLFRKKFNKIILSYWGSDLYRSSFIKRLMVFPLLRVSSSISFITVDMLNYFSGLYGKYREKCVILDFGNQFFDEIDACLKNYENEKNEIKRYFNLSQEKIVIVVGYCGRVEMRQLETIQALLSLPREIIQNVQFAIPAWGIDNVLKQKISAICEHFHVSYQIYTSFMNPYEIVRFRTVADIFIHAQITDALSSAMLEHLYAGSIVINGSWLRYNILQNNDIQFVSFLDFQELPKIFQNVLLNYAAYKEAALKNRIKVKQIASWDTWRSRWINLYK